MMWSLRWLFVLQRIFSGSRSAQMSWWWGGKTQTQPTTLPLSWYCHWLKVKRIRERLESPWFSAVQSTGRNVPTKSFYMCTIIHGFLSTLLSQLHNWVGVIPNMVMWASHMRLKDPGIKQEPWIYPQLRYTAIFDCRILSNKQGHIRKSLILWESYIMQWLPIPKYMQHTVTHNQQS